MRFKWKEPMRVFCRVKGKGTRMREIGAMLDPNYRYCCMPKTAALDLGFGEVLQRPEDYEALRADLVPTVIALRGLEKCIVFTLPEVSIGRLVARNVQTLVLSLDLPFYVPVDIILGQTFLRNFRLTVDVNAGYLSLTPRRKS